MASIESKNRCVTSELKIRKRTEQFSHHSIRFHQLIYPLDRQIKPKGWVRIR